MSDNTISPLRQRMIEDMTARRFTEDARETTFERKELRGLPRPVAGYGDARSPDNLVRHATTRTARGPRASPSGSAYRLLHWR